MLRKYLLAPLKIILKNNFFRFHAYQCKTTACWIAESVVHCTQHSKDSAKLKKEHVALVWTQFLWLQQAEILCIYSVHAWRYQNPSLLMKCLTVQKDTSHYFMFTSFIMRFAVDFPHLNLSSVQIISLCCCFNNLHGLPCLTVLFSTFECLEAPLVASLTQVTRIIVAADLPVLIAILRKD